ncbi:MAG: hypothetical protein HY070_13845 [Chloroflexi bacterium]|nr:hypothetical protein [Chloroflexota bacterium]
MTTRLWFTITTAVAAGIVLGALALALIAWYGMSAMMNQMPAMLNMNQLMPQMNGMNEMMQKMMGGMMGR